MDYPLDWGHEFTTVFSLDKIMKFSKIVILEFSDSLAQILVSFLSRKIVGWATWTEYFQMTALFISYYKKSLITS